MNYFKIGDRVFDVRYGWGLVTQSHNKFSVMVKFSNQEEVVLYGQDAAKRILSYTEYVLEGFTSERPKITWDSIWKEWYNLEAEEIIGIQFPKIPFKDYLDQNFEPPIRKCK
jgi:hypothetical protein